MKQPNPKEQWNNYSSKYANIWTGGSRTLMRKNEMNFIKKFIFSDTKKLLDVGCGTGRILEEYCGSNNILEIYGIDIAEKMVEICHQKQMTCSKIKAIEVCDISCEEIPYNVSFDLVSAIRVFKYNKNWKQILEKLLKKCSTRGMVVFTIPNSRSINRLANFISTILRKENNYFIFRSNYGELKRICDNANCELLEISSFSKIPDFLYDLSKSEFYGKVVLSVERFLEILFGKILFGKELFVAIKKK